MKVNLEPKGVKQLEVYILNLEKEHQELNQKYLNAIADYEQEKFTVEELKKELEDMTLCRDIASGHRKEVQNRETILLKENQELKKQLEKKYSKPGTFTTELLYEENTKLINQQKEFIEYLEEEIERKEEYLIAYSHEEREYKLLKEILSKYKEIIGEEKCQK